MDIVCLVPRPLLYLIRPCLMGGGGLGDWGLTRRVPTSFHGNGGVAGGYLASPRHTASVSLCLCAAWFLFFLETTTAATAALRLAFVPPTPPNSSLPLLMGLPVLSLQRWYSCTCLDLHSSRANNLPVADSNSHERDAARGVSRLGTDVWAHIEF